MRYSKIFSLIFVIIIGFFVYWVIDKINWTGIILGIVSLIISSIFWKLFLEEFIMPLFGFRRYFAFNIENEEDGLYDFYWFFTDSGALKSLDESYDFIRGIDKDGVYSLKDDN